MQRLIRRIGAASLRQGDRVVGSVRYVGGLVDLSAETVRRFFGAVLGTDGRLRWSALASQMVRVGIKSVSIVVTVQIFIGVILALQLAPTLAAYGQLERVADVVAIAVVRELGPLLTGVVMSGFAGASIAAELGAMVEAEEIKALRAHALNPIRFLVVPRVLATTTMIVGLALIADFVGVFGGFLTGVFVLDVPPWLYVNLTQAALSTADLFTGLAKAAIFGGVISIIACYEGLHVTGGSEGVGRATTATVVKSIVALIGIDAVFTTVFYTLGI